MFNETWYKCVESFEFCGDEYEKGEEYPTLSDEILEEFPKCFKKIKKKKETYSNSYSTNSQILHLNSLSIIGGACLSRFSLSNYF